MAMTYDEFQRRRKAGETVQDLANETNASKPPETYSVPYGTLTYDEFKNARQAGVKLDDLVEVGKTKPAPSVYQTRASDYARRVMDTEAENNWGKPDTRTTLQKATDKLLGVDRTKVTGGKTDWGKLAEGAAVKGANQANAGFWSGVGIFNDIGKKITNSKVGNWLFGDLADGANAIATTTINGAIDTINSIFGTNYAGIKNGQSALDFLVSDAQAGKANAQTKYEANANTSRAAQIIDQFGTATVAAIPMAIEAAVLAPTQAAQAAQVTTSGLSYFSGLQNAKGVEAVGMMGREGLNKLFRNPQFWTSYLQAAGDGYESAKEDGMNQDDAAVYALTNGFFNAMVEVGGADEALGGIQNLPMRMRQAAESGNKSAVVNWFKDSVLGEAWEEVQQGALERGIKSLFGQDVPIFSADPTDDRAIINPYTAGQEFLGGAVVGGLLGGGQVAANTAVQGLSDSRTFKGDAQALIKAAKNSAQEADQASIAQIESDVAARKGNTMTMGEARTLQEIASRTGNMHAYVQNIMQQENQQRAEQKREATQQNRVSRYLERVRAGEVDQTGTADTKGATIQYAGRQAKVDFVRDGDQNRVRLTFEDGTERTVSYQEAADAGLDENVQNLMVALSAIGPNAPAAYSVYESDQEVGRYAAAMDEAINLYAAQGQDVRKAAAAARESNSPAMITYLTDAQLELAQSLGSKIYEQKQTQVQEAGAKLAEIRQAAQQAMSAQDVTETEGLAAVNATLTDARQHLKNVGAAFNDTMEYLDEMAANGQEGTEAYQNALEQANALRDDLYGTQKVIEALAEERKNLQAQQPIKRKQGTVSFAGGTINGEKVNGVDRSKLNRQQKNVVAMVEALADAVNVDYVFFDGDARGNQGAYVQGGTVYINVNAGMAANKALAAATLSHELTHYMQEFAPEEYEQLKQFIISNVLQKGELDRLVQQQLRLEPNLSYDQALDEVVANACQTMLMDSKAIAKLARQNMTLAEKIADYIEDITARLKAAFEDVNYQDNLPLYNAVKAMEDQLDEMQRLWDAGIEAATENYNAVQQTRGQTETTEEAMPAAAQRADTQTLNEQAEQAGISIDEETESAYPNAVQFSRQSWEESEYSQKRDEAAVALSTALGVSKRKALTYIDSINGVAKAIANDQQRLDYEASEGVSALIGNTEYGGSIDFSTICKKRRLMTGTFTAIQRALPNTALTAEEILTIRRMMDDKGDEVSCGLCYVEGSRAKMGIYAKQFLERYAKTNPDYLPNMAEINTPEGIEQIRRQHPEIYDAYVKFMNGLAQRKPKLYQMATEYAGEVLNKFLGKKNQVDKYNHNGGLRLQSFSDFEIIHLIDNMQVILDMARVGLNGQAYTKVPEFAWAMGNTGLKINLSLIAKGVDESGHIILDEKEGMKRADAEALRNAYSDNVGTILVIFNDEQLRAAMADDFIDFIIPFHRSQWNSQQYALMGLPEGAKDYTMQQNESYIEPVLNSNGKPTRPANYMPNNYWDYSKTGKENAENYLRMCAENNRKPKFSNLLVDNGDGSYSLQPDGSTDGYWKLLIDFKMYDNDGNGVPQRPVQPIFNEGSEEDPHTVLGMLKAYKGGHQTFPVDQEIVDRFVSQYKAAHPNQTQFQAWDSMTKEEQDREIQKNIAFNESQTQTGSPLKTLKGSDINRGGTLSRIRYPIGKVIAERLYIHKDYVDSAIAVNPAFGTALEKAEDALRAAYPDFEYNCVNYHPKSGEIQFQEAPDFDTGREPVVGHQVNVAADGTVSPIKSFGQIWHHKWQWVDNDYKGFDVRESWEWSKEWLSTILGSSKGGSIKAWNGQLAEYGLPADTGVRNQQWDNEESAPVSQEFNSKDTSINIDKLPSVFSNNWFKRELHPGGVNIDIGGGKYDNAAEYLKQFGVTNMVFDPYNRTEEHNQGVLDYIMDGNRADTVTCANVLNVIKEAGARENVILECAKAMKPDGKAYFLIYEGDKSTNGRITKTPVRDRNGKIQKDENGKTIYSTSWQEHRDAKSYIDEIKKYFNTVKPHSNLIVAEDPKADLPRAAWETTEGKATRYQMWEGSPIEDVGDNLVAVHNVTEEKLLPALKLGGLPMPSIAIVKAKTGHSNYGPISLLFGTRTIDPKQNRRNKVYGADAWTPMRADVEREINGKRLDEIETRLKELADKTLGGLYSTYSPIRQRIGDDAYSGDVDNLVERFAPDPTFNAAYAADKGITIEPEYAEVTYGGSYGNESVKEYIALIGIDKLTELEDRLESGRWEVSDSEMQDIINSVEKGLLKGFNSRPSLARKRAENIANNSRWVKFINDAWAYHLNQGKKTSEIDKMRTAEKLTNAVYESGWDEYKAWIRNELEGLIGEPGIANGKERYYPDGRRKSFWQTHDTYTLANVVKAMSRGNARGAGIHLGATHLQSITAKDYSNLSDVKKDSGRLRKTTEEEYTQQVKQVDEHLTTLVNKIAAYNEDTSYFAKDIIGEMIIQAARGSHTVAGLQKTFRQESDYELSPELAKELAETYQEAADLPTEYFEAKPQRAIGFDEVEAAIIPSNSSEELRTALAEAGVNTIEYEADNEDQRLAALQSVKDVQFQKWDNTSDDTASEDAGRRMAYAMIQAENNALKDAVNALNALTSKQNTTIAKLEKALKLTKTPEVRQSDANRLARQLVKDYSSTADRTRIAAELKALGDYILQNKKIDADTVKQRARAIAAELVENAEVVDDLGGELATYRGITDDIRGKKLTIDEDFIGELGTADGYDAFRKANFGNFTLAKRGTGESAGREGYTTVGGFYQTLQQAWGEAYFPNVANEGEQIQVIADMFQRAKGITVNPNEDYMGEATEELANRIAFDVMDGIMRPMPPTQADRQKARLDEARQEARTAEREAERAGERAAATIYDLTTALDSAQSRQKTLTESIRELERQGELSEKEAQRMAETIYDLSIALDNAESRYKTLRASARERYSQLREEGRARATEAAMREREKANERISALKNYYHDLADRARERRNEAAGSTKYRKKIQQQVKKLSDWLMKNSDKEHVPEAIKAPLLDFLTAIDFTSKRALRGGEQTQNDVKFGARLQKLQQMLQNQQRYIDGDGNVQQDLGGYIDIGPDMQQVLQDMAQRVTDAMETGETYTINTMSAAELKDLSNLISTLTTGIRNMNSFMANARYASVREAAAQDIQTMEKLGKVKDSDSSMIAKFLKWKDATPYYAMKRFGQGGRSIFDGLTRGWEKLAQHAQQIISFTEKAYTDKEVNAWKKEMQTFTLEDGSEIRMTTAQIMELAMLLKRPQAVQHITKGGIRIGNIETTAKGQKRTITDTTHYHLTADDIVNVLDTLTDRQREVANTLQKYMAEQGAKWGNEITMRRFGYEFYTEGENYYPIRTDDNTRPMADTDAQQNSMFRLLNLSSSKSLNPKASNALVVNDMFDTFADHMADQAKLNALGLPILDAIKWFNYRERVDLGDGAYNTVTMQAAMEQAYGEQAKRYFRTLMKDINGVTESGDRGTDLASRMMSNYKIASVGANLRVAMLQPTAYVRAQTVISPRNLIRAFAYKNGIKEAMEHSGTAIWKSLGYYDTNISRNMRQQIQHNETVRDKLVEKSMKLAEHGDQVTWGRLWVACKLQAQDMNPGIEGEELMQKTADLFREVVYSSQVMDSTLTRSELMRSHSFWDKNLTAFMAEPTLSYNIMMDAYMTYENDVRANGRQGAWQRNSETLRRAFTVYMSSAVVSAIAESIADAIRDDDDDETAIDKFLQAFLGEDSILDGNMFQDVILTGKIPYAKNIWSLLQGYENSDMIFGGISNLIKVFEIWRETVQLATGDLEKPTKVTYYGNMTEWGKIYKTLQSISQISGFPISGGMRDVFAIWNATVGNIVPYWKVKTYDKNRLSQSQKNAYNENLKGSGITEGQYQQMRTEMDVDGNGSLKQDEVGMYLNELVKAGKITEEQAASVWATAGPSWKKTYSEWNGKPVSTEEPAAATTTTAVRPAPTPESVKITTYDQFKSAAHIYSDKRETAYNLWESSVQPLGIDLDRYTQYINVSDVNDNGSVTQEELGATLTEAINRGELNGDQAEAIWHTLWNGGRSKTYASWAAKNATRGGMPSQEELLELNENPDRYDVGDTTVTAAEILAETLDRGQTITRVGETYQLIPGEYPSRKQYGEWLPVLDELGIDPGDVWENGQHVTLSQMSQYYTPEEFRDEIEYRRKNKWWIDLGFEEEPAYAANELYLGWQENPDYPGQTFEEYLNTPESQSWLQQLAQTQSEAAGGEWDRFTGGTARTYTGTGQKARRTGAALYVSRVMRDSKRGRR